MSNTLNYNRFKLGVVPCSYVGSPSVFTFEVTGTGKYFPIGFFITNAVNGASISATYADFLMTQQGMLRIYGFDIAAVSPAIGDPYAGFSLYGMNPVLPFGNMVNVDFANTFSMGISYDVTYRTANLLNGTTLFTSFDPLLYYLAQA